MQPQPGSPSLKILSGPQSGSATELDPADETLIGSDSGCHLQADGLSPIQARIVRESEGYVVYDTRSPLGVWVNDQRVSDRLPLRDGDILWLGAPDDPASVMVQCRLGGDPYAISPAPDRPAEDPVDSGFFIDPVLAEPPPERPAEPSFAPEDAPEVAPDFIVDSGPSAPAPETPPFGSEDEVFFVDDSTAPPPPVVPPVVEEAFFLAEEVQAPVPAPPVEAPPPAPVPAPVAAPAPPAAPRPRPAPVAPRAAPPATPAKPASSPPPAVPRPPSPRPGPAAGSRTPARAAVPMSAPRRASGGGSPKLILLIVAGVLVLAIAIGAAFYFLRAPSVATLQPERVRIGDTITVHGKNLAASPAQNEVLFGDVPGRVVEASSTAIKVEVPAMRLVPGQDTALSVRIRSGGRETRALSVTIFEVPLIKRLTPDVAMPGDEVTIEGSGWKDQATVRFGAQPAEVLSVSTATGVRVRVPATSDAPGTELPVVIVVGGAESPAASFVVGRLPMVQGCEPAQATLGGVVRVKGRGFSADPAGNRVRVANVPALVASATERELQILVPRVPMSASELAATVEILVEGREGPGQISLTLTAPPDPLDLRLIAEPHVDAAGQEHAVLGTEMGPAFVLAASGGKTAGRRAAEALEQWNAALVRLRASLQEDVEARDLDTRPVLALKGRPQALLEVTEEDAAAYNPAGGKGAPVTPARLAVWWEALARDLVLVVLRGKPPQHTLDFGPEGRALAQLQDRARKTGKFGVPRDVVAALKPAERDALRVLGLRVPAGVPVSGARPVAPPAGAAAAAAAALDGTWRGWEREGVRQRTISVTFAGASGTLTYQGGVALTIPLTRVEQPQKGVVKFSAMIRGGVRHYTGRWDGEKMTGTITQEGAAPPDTGTFELSR